MKFFYVLFTVLFISACSDSDFDDLKIFVDDIENSGEKPPIEPLPTFIPYEPFDYSATLLRAPFDKPISIVDPLIIKPAS